jgi:UDP-glucuronate 4-epimerase
MIRKILVTGAAGFIGHHIALRLSTYYNVVACDYLGDIYTTNQLDMLKSMRVKRLATYRTPNPALRYDNCDLSNHADVERLFSYENFDAVIHLAAATGVQPSITRPHKYATSNMLAFSNVIEFAARSNVREFIYASSSSVYGADASLPMKEDADVNKPLNFYAASKRSNELVAHSYSANYPMRTIGLRFFTVFGDYGRLDMAPYKFVNSILNDEPIQLYNFGQNTRDFTHISTVTFAVEKLLARLRFSGSLNLSSEPMSQVINIGSGNPISTQQFLNELESIIGKKANVMMSEALTGDMIDTYACTEKMKALGLYQPHFVTDASRKMQLTEFVNWVKLFQTYNQPLVASTPLDLGGKFT